MPPSSDISKAWLAYTQLPVCIARASAVTCNSACTMLEASGLLLSQLL